MRNSLVILDDGTIAMSKEVLTEMLNQAFRSGYETHVGQVNDLSALSVKFSVDVVDGIYKAYRQKKEEKTNGTKAD